MRLIIDRFEGRFAVCENDNGEMINIGREKLPREAQEGDTIIMENGSYVVDLTATESRKDKISKLMDDLWK